MKFTINKENLVTAVQVVQNIVSPKTTLPILANILIEISKDGMTLNATDLDIGISCGYPVNVIEEGAITIPAKRFNDIIRELPPGEITIHAKKNHQVDIEGNQCRFKLNGLPKDEFPKFPEFDKTNQISISQSDFKDMLRLTSFAVSHEESRYILNGVLIEINQKNIRVVATDGRRLAKIEKNIKEAGATDVSVIIPIKAVHEIMRNLSDEGDLKIIFGQNQIFFDINGILIATRIIEGEFPNYNQVIPKPVDNKVLVDTKDLLSSIKRANLLATPDFQAVKFELFSNRLVISKSTPDVGESREEMKAEYSGSEIAVGFNPQYLIDFLKNIDEEKINIELTGVNKPAVIRLKEYLYLALPMRI